MDRRTTSTSKLVIVDYGTGNVNSVKRALDRMSARSTVSSSSEDIANADKIILPGVGHFGTAIENLKRLDLVDALNEAVLEKRTPVLGICLGMELMATRSEEANVAGFGWVDAAAVRFNISDTKQYKVPHMGWNRVSIKKDSVLMSRIDESAEFYFAHSYYLRMNDGNDVLSETQYEMNFVSAIEKDNIFGVQFHPEKSHDAGVQILKNFVEL